MLCLVARFLVVVVGFSVLMCLAARFAWLWGCVAYMLDWLCSSTIRP